MPETRLRLLIIVGSIRNTRFAPTVATWFTAAAQRHESMTVDVVDLAEVSLPVVMRGFHDPLPDEVAALAPRLAQADAFVIITPEYNHSYPAALKNMIDWYGQEWHAKPVGFVSYGGISGGLRSVEHLRQVFAELHAVTVRDTVSFHGAWEQFDAHGEPVDRPGCDAAAKTMLDQLNWWAEALQQARTRRPYTR